MQLHHQFQISLYFTILFFLSSGILFLKRDSEIPEEFAQNNIFFCEKPVFKHAEMVKDGTKMAQRWQYRPSSDYKIPVLATKSGTFTLQ